MVETSLIVLAWNRWDLTRRCLETLRQTDLAGAAVIVVDNGSSDETPRHLAAMDWVRVLTLPRNVGFVRGNNAGIAAAAPHSDIVLLNNDLEFTQRDWLTRLRACAGSAPDVGIVGCRLALPGRRLLHAGTYIVPDTCWGQQIGSLEKDIGQYPGDRDVQGIVFACAYIRRPVLDRIGGLALDFESYFEDTDYCLRARACGFRTLVCGGVTLVHDEHGSTQGASASRLRIFEQSRRVFRRKWERELERGYEHRLLWQSILNFPTGYARSSRDLLHALEENGVRTIYRYVYGPGGIFPKREPEGTGDYLLEVVRARKPRLRPPVSVVYGQGDVFHRSHGRYKIGYTMLEVDGFPPDWVRAANRMDEVWVPSEANRQAFLRGGLERPIHLVPLGVDTNYFHPAIQTVRNPRDEFVFLACFEWGERKDPWLLLHTFSETFSAGEPVRLLCKINNVDPEISIGEEIRRLDLAESGGRISYILNLEFPHHQLGALYTAADCFIAVSRGEGWDMPLMEAMACGLPAIATDWGAHQEYVHGGIAYPLRVRGTVPAIAKCPYYSGFSWADPDPDHLRHLLREVYENRGEARRRGLAASREMAEKWTWTQAAKKIKERLEEIGA